jgi:hypothetical protein
MLGRSDTGTATLSLRPVRPLKIENTYLFERLRTIRTGSGIFNNHILRSKWNWQFNPQLSVRVILQYNSVLANTPCDSALPSCVAATAASSTYLPTSKQFNADFLITYLVHPGTAIYVGYNSDLQNLNRNLDVDPTYGLRSSKGYIHDSRQFFVKVSYLFRF